MNPPNNVIRVPPRRFPVRYKGMHGWVEYHPVSKTWTYKVKLLVTQTYEGEAPTEAEAVLEVKRVIEIVAVGGTSFRSID